MIALFTDPAVATLFNLSVNAFWCISTSYNLHIYEASLATARHGIDTIVCINSLRAVRMYVGISFVYMYMYDGTIKKSQSIKGSLRDATLK